MSYCDLRGELVVSPGVRRLTATDNPNLRAVAPLPESLEALDLSGCAGLRALPAPLPQRLRELRLHFFLGTALPPLPAGLEALDLLKCRRLTALPVLPASLRELRLRGLGGHLHGALMPLPRLEVLDLFGSLQDWLPQPLLDDRAGFPMLRELDVSGSKTLRNAGGLYLPQLQRLVLGFSFDVPERLHEFTALSELDYTGDVPPTFPPLPPGLQSFTLRGCAQLRSVELPPRLKSLELRHGTSLQSLPQLPAGLTELVMVNAPSVSVSAVGGELPRGLQVLRLVRCPFALDFEFPAGLRVLELKYNPGVSLTMPLERLEELVLEKCELTALPSARLFPELRVLDVGGNPALRLSADNWPERLERLVVHRDVEVRAGGATEVVRRG